MGDSNYKSPVQKRTNARFDKNEQRLERHGMEVAARQAKACVRCWHIGRQAGHTHECFMLQRRTGAQRVIGTGGGGYSNLERFVLGASVDGHVLENLLRLLFLVLFHDAVDLRALRGHVVWD